MQTDEPPVVTELRVAANKVENVRRTGIAEHLAGWEHLSIRKAADQIEAFQHERDEEVALRVGAIDRMKAAEAERDRMREVLSLADAWFQRALPKTDDACEWLTDEGWDEMDVVAAKVANGLGIPA